MSPQKGIGRGAASLTGGNSSRLVPDAQLHEIGDAQYAPLITEQGELATGAKTILLHSCCGPCSTSVVERLAPDFDITILFYNPNITDMDEYERRLEAQRRFVERHNALPDVERAITLVPCGYGPEEFFARVRGFEHEPEGGERCGICFRMRLERTAEYAALHGFERFATTLSVSPRKDSKLILGIGLQLAMKFGLTFHAEDFKKRDGYKRSVELSRAYGLYRQNYCGCEFSRRESGVAGR